MTKEQWEEDAILRFIKHLKIERDSDYRVIGRDVRPNPDSAKDYDFELEESSGSKAAVEIFRLIEDGKELAREATWGTVIKLLKDELLRRNIRGYAITTRHFQVKKNELTAFSISLADKIARAVVDNDTKEDFEVGEFEFRKIKDFDSLIFSRSSEVRSVNPSGIATNGFTTKLPTKNLQVAAAEHERILLVLNWVGIVDASDATHALSKIDFDQFLNVDQIYFEERPDVLRLVFDRRIDVALKSGETGIPLSPLFLEILRYRLGDKDRQAFAFVQTQTKTAGDIRWLDDPGARQNLVHFGDEFLKSGEIEETLWIIRQLERDPDPSPDGSATEEDDGGRINYHGQVLKGEKTGIITTVRGHLCWLIMRVIQLNEPHLYREMIEIVSRYLSEPNLYIRIHATYPLGALAMRRKALKRADGASFDWAEDERLWVTDLALQALRANAAFPRVLEALLQVFHHMRDLNHKLAAEVVLTFLAAKQDYVMRSLAPLVIYFALFRKDEFTTEGDFDPSWFVKILEEQICYGVAGMRANLAWHFWKMANEGTMSIADCRPYIFLFLQGTYEPGVHANLGLLLKCLAKPFPDDAADVLEKMLQRLSDSLHNGNSSPSFTYINGVEEVFGVVGSYPDKLMRMSSLLKDVWTRGCYIPIPTVFQSYASVSSNRKSEVRAHLSKLYDEMKALAPGLPEVNWTL